MGLRITVLSLTLTALGCYRTRPQDCRVRCGDGEACPSEMVCLSDGWCHMSEDEESCDVLVDGDPEDRPTYDAPPRPDGEIPADAVPLPDAGLGCGNGLVEAGELCDDGNDVDGDACVRCQPARCGDGVVRPILEQCDDGNLSDGDGCTSKCLACGAANQFAGGQGRCLTRHGAGMETTWDEATRACGFGHLAGFSSQSSQNTVFNALLAGTTGPYWIGIHDARVEGTFEHVTFEARSYTDWQSGQPDNVMGQDCVGIRVATENWYDYDCGTPQKYLCEDEGTWVIGPDGHGYRVIWGRATWDQARAACQALGGHLATMASAAENDAVMPAMPADDRIHAWIGADDSGVEGSFVWTTGEPFSFQDFVTPQPDGDGDCVAISPALGGWSDVDCTTKRPFVCEVE